MVKSRKFVRTLSLFIFAFCVLVPSLAVADLVKAIHFDTANDQSGASISYAGGSAPLVGTGISVDKVFGENTTPDNQLTITGGVLSFTTGNLLSTTTVNGVTLYTFDKGGFITLTGSIAGITGTNLIYNGVFTTAVVTSVPLLGSSRFDIVGASFSDSKNNELAQYYGFPVNLSWIGNLNISFYAETVNGGFRSYVNNFIGSGDILNTPVPLPPAAWLLGSGLIGMVVLRRRMKK